MKKKLIIGCLAVLLLAGGAVIFVGFTPDTSQIGKPEALQIALDATGVSSTMAYDCRVKLQSEEGEEEYSVDFKTTGVRYYCQINAQTGQVLNIRQEEIE